MIVGSACLLILILLVCFLSIFTWELGLKPSYLPWYGTAQIRCEIGNTMNGGCNGVQYDTDALSSSIVRVTSLYQLPLG